MSRRARNRPEGYEALSLVTDAAIAAVRHDMSVEPEDSLALYRDLARANPDLAGALLSDAREEKEQDTDPEKAYIKGALFMARLSVKMGLADMLTKQFSMTEQHTPSKIPRQRQASDE